MLIADIRKVTLNTSPGSRVLLNGIIFRLDPGFIYTILGKNGSGKSTLIKTLTGLNDNRFYETDASVLFYGEDILLLSEEKLNFIRRKKIKYVFQDAAGSFDPLKKLEYYFKLLLEDHTKLDDELDFFLLPPKDKLFKLYPYEISGGMAQRVAFILALLSDPDLIILDEPTSGVDVGTANLFIHRLKEFVASGKKSILLVTQDVLFAEKVSSFTAVLRDKRLTDFFPADNFSASEVFTG